MKKTLAAVAVLGAFAGSALAADVTLYGKVDLGLNYTHTDVDGVSSDNWGMKSGQNSGSRFGIKGTEQISDGLTVGFQLENGFDADDGRFKYGNDDGERMFGREARLFVQTDFGELGFGRMGGLDSGSGSYDIFGGKAGVFGTGWSGIGSDSAIFLGMSSRYDNMITYKSPEFAGLTLVAQASLSRDSSAEDDEGTHLADRYYAIGMGADYGALTGALTFSMQDYGGISGRKTGTDTPAAIADGEYNDSDGYTVTAYGAYDFGVTKVSLGAQYFDNVAQVRGSIIGELDGKTGDFKWEDVDFGVTGYGVILGAITPIGSGSLFTSVSYADYEAAKLSDKADQANLDKADYKVYGVGVGYQYPLSKRTYVYTAASYTHQTSNAGETWSKDLDTDTTEVMAGLVHSF